LFDENANCGSSTNGNMSSPSVHSRETSPILTTAPTTLRSGLKKKASLEHPEVEGVAGPSRKHALRSEKHRPISFTISDDQWKWWRLLNENIRLHIIEIEGETQLEKDKRSRIKAETRRIEAETRRIEAEERPEKQKQRSN
jgi:hypothetical protein